eukprot:TRINITY_DN13098_c0_g1_i1.p1 TRINITY_DN13098_c0_g1~~TRINITY_DN13098_c0_g1_i1.p1  ORF type:complete len:235 (+),score=42.99 TRINITY_DN13098_c0_g1_i1:64-768(+)
MCIRDRVVGTLSAVALLMSLRFIVKLETKRNRGALAGMENMNSAIGGGMSGSTTSNVTTTTHTNLQGNSTIPTQPPLRVPPAGGNVERDRGVDGLSARDINIQLAQLNGVSAASSNPANRVQIENASLGLENNNGGGSNSASNGPQSNRRGDNERNSNDNNILGSDLNNHNNNILIRNVGREEGHARNVSEFMPLADSGAESGLGQPRSPQSDDDGQGRGFRKKKNLQILVEDS